MDAAAFAARALAEQLHEKLAARGLACTRLGVHVRTEHGEELGWVWRCAEPLIPAGIADRVRRKLAVDSGGDVRLMMSEDFEMAEDPWFGEPHWPVRRPVLPPWLVPEFRQQADDLIAGFSPVIPTPRHSPEWLRDTT
jgi:hypothetical protein